MQSTKSFLNKHKLNLMLAFVLVWGLILRFYKIDLMPITLDEFSAFFRLHFNSFDELIDKGVKLDGHPAGVQTFLYYWTKLVGASSWVLKIPFVLFGVGSIYYIYKLSAQWFSSTAALWIVSFFASIQYTIFYSQVFRPYATGMFFTLLTSYHWSKILFSSDDKVKSYHYILFVVGSILATYNHHFSLFFIFILAVTGLFYVPKIYLKQYLLACVIIAVSYIPHLTIFFYQLNIGGLEASLPRPTLAFFHEYLDYIFQYSWFTRLLALVMFGLSIYGFFKENKAVKFIFLSVILFMIPLSVGFFYSVFRSPVLQFSVLIFSFPFLLFLLFGSVPKFSTKVTFLGVLIILLMNTLGLTIDRKYYNLFYKSNYEQALLNGEKYNSKGIYKLIEANDIHKKVTFYYMHKHKVKNNWKFISPIVDFVRFRKQLNEISSNYDTLFFACDFSSYPCYIPMIQSYFPKLEKKWDYLNGTSYLFTKSKSNQKLITKMDFTYPTSGWTSFENIKGIDQSGVCNVDSLNEYVVTYDAKLWDIIGSPNDFIDVSLRVYLSNGISKAMVTSSLDDDNGNVDWRSTSFSSFQDTAITKDSWITVYHTIKLSDINVRDKNLKLKIGVWNIEKESFRLDDIEIKCRKGNPYLYGVAEKYYE